MSARQEQFRKPDEMYFDPFPLLPKQKFIYRLEKTNLIRKEERKRNKLY